MTGSKTCYMPGGKDRNSTLYHACDPDDGVQSMCCSEFDTCMSNGLCYNERTGGIWWRESCTDPDFTSSNCNKMFLDVHEDVPVKNCTDGSWCRTNVTDCCQEKNRVFLLANNSTIPLALVSEGNVGNNSIVSSTATPLPRVTSSPSSSSNTSSLSTGAKAGIGVGVVLGALVIAAVVFWFVRVKRRTQIQNQEHQNKEPFIPKELPGSPSKRREIDSAPVYETSGTQVRMMNPVEMEG